MPTLRHTIWTLALLVFLLAATSIARSQPYPNRAVRVIVGFAPGGSTDTTSRLIAPRLGERLGQPVVIDNRPGAQGNIAAELVAKANPDGYTIFMAAASHSINASLYPKMAFNAINDFTAISNVTSSPFILVSHPSVPARSVRELIALGKKKPGYLNYGSGGSASHLAGELFNSMAGVNFIHIPYKSSGPAATDLLGGQVTLMFSAPSAVLQHVVNGKLRALGIASERRLSFVPEIPTIAESGLAGYHANSWSGLLGPAGMPKEVVNRLNADIRYVMGLPDILSRLPPLGLEAATNTPEEFSSDLRADVSKWARVVLNAGIVPH